jgi:hypothetical protein
VSSAGKEATLHISPGVRFRNRFMSHPRKAPASLPIASGTDFSQQDTWAKRNFYARKVKFEKTEDFSREMRAVRSILFPREYQRTSIRMEGPVQEYLNGCYQNLLAEYWNRVQNFHNKIRSEESYFQIEGIRQFDEGSWYFDKVSRLARDSNAKEDSEPFLTEDNLSYLAIFRGHLCMTTRHGSNLGLLIGIQLDRLSSEYHKELRGRDTENRLCMLGYVKVFVHDLTAILEMMDSAAAQPKILDAIANPKLIGTFEFAEFHPRRLLKGSIPCSTEQRQIVKNLKNEIEGIQGPPGTGTQNAICLINRPLTPPFTGKSTTIFHILRTRVPIGTLALVTSVQNKAVESIAEKLKSNFKETPFFVFGQERNLGKVSAEFLLERFSLLNPLDSLPSIS